MERELQEKFRTINQKIDDKIEALKMLYEKNIELLKEYERLEKQQDQINNYKNYIDYC